MKKFYTFLLALVFTLGFIGISQAKSVSHADIDEIIRSQISEDAEITFGDRRYMRLVDHQVETFMAAKKLVTTPHKYLGPMYDCEDIARAAQVRFVASMCNSLIKKDPHALYHGVPIGIVTFGNRQIMHVINILICNGQTIMYDVGWEQLWTVEDIEGCGFWVMKVAF